MKWYWQESCNGRAMIADEDDDTGKTIALCYGVATARLIAAAPEMLAALKDAIPCLVDLLDAAKASGKWVSEGLTEDALDRARAAVAAVENE